MRTYEPHDNDRRAAILALQAINTRRLRAGSHEIDALLQVRDSHPGDTVTQRTICLAHDVIDRMRSTL